MPQHYAQAQPVPAQAPVQGTAPPPLGSALQGSSQTGGVVPGPPATPEEKEARKAGFRSFFASPEVQAFALQMGINLLQPRSVGQTGGGQLARSIGAGAEASGRVLTAEQARGDVAVEQAQAQTGLDIQRAGVDVQADRNTVAREGQESVSTTAGLDRTARLQLENIGQTGAGERNTASIAGRASDTRVGAEATIEAAGIAQRGGIDRQLIAERAAATVATIAANAKAATATVPPAVHLAAALRAVNPGMTEGESILLAEGFQDRGAAMTKLQADWAVMNAGLPMTPETLERFNDILDNSFGLRAVRRAAGVGAGALGTPDPAATGPQGLPPLANQYFQQQIGKSIAKVVKKTKTNSGNFIYDLEDVDGRPYVLIQSGDNFEIRHNNVPSR